MTRRLITPPEPAITLTQAKAQVRAIGSEEDALLSAYVTAAGQYVERLAGQAIGAQVWEEVLDAFPTGRLALDWGPVVSVVSVAYLDGDGQGATVDAGLYRLDGDAVLPLASWPAGSAVVVRYVAGQGWTEPACQAVRLLVAYWFDNRAAAGEPVHEAPLAFTALVSSLRRMSA